MSDHSRGEFFLQNLVRWLLLAAVAALCGCLPPVDGPAPLPDREGHVRLYLQLAPGGSAQLRFALGEIAALGDDGARYPLPALTEELSPSAQTGAQMLLARGSLPGGAYRGFSVTAKEAFVLGEEGEGSLALAEEPVFLDLPFRLKTGDAKAFYLVLDPLASVAEGYRFSPVVHALPGREELVALKGYVSEAPDRLLSVFDKVTLHSVGLIGTRSAPAGIALDPDRQIAYVALPEEDAVEVIDLNQRRILWRILLRYGDRPRELALTPDRRTLVVADSGTSTVSLVDTASLVEKARIRVGEEPSFVVVDGVGERAFVLNRLTNSVSVISLPGATLIGDILLDGSPKQAVLNASGEELLVSGDSPTLTVIDLARLEVTDSLWLDMPGEALKLDSRTGLLYLGLAGTPRLAVIDPFTLTETGAIDVAGPVTYLAIDFEDNALLALASAAGVLEKIDIVGQQVIEHLPVVPGSYAVVVLRER